MFNEIPNFEINNPAAKFIKEFDIAMKNKEREYIEFLPTDKNKRKHPMILELLNTEYSVEEDDENDENDEISEIYNYRYHIKCTRFGDVARPPVYLTLELSHSNADNDDCIAIEPTCYYSSKDYGVCTLYSLHTPDRDPVKLARYVRHKIAEYATDLIDAIYQYLHTNDFFDRKYFK